MNNCSFYKRLILFLRKHTLI
ncbi:hypothetical protein CY0110_17197 [Crocosphaera chwakensis CCY0110]|uniref:Uncharacterized protein n=1 Tax=Crocosphaera chwakensis CCY0110 TaxID=391612 RepID=A3IIC1_9CHRO|nr:hypothetical protein CY0110_17197 [Crocosphaera chwakensis CCY0110]